MLRAQYCINCESDYVSCGELIHNNSFEATNHPSGLSYCDGNLENACCWFKLTTHKSVVDHLYVSYPDANSINNYCGDANWDTSPNPTSVNIYQLPSSGAPFGNLLPTGTYFMVVQMPFGTRKTTFIELVY